jgi:hypothetical protein
MSLIYEKRADYHLFERMWLLYSGEKMVGGINIGNFPNSLVHPMVKKRGSLYLSGKLIQKKSGFGVK